MGARFSWLAGLALLAACAPSAADAPIAEQWRSVEVEALPLAFGAETVGALRFRGGLELRSRDGAFGGFSGVETLDNGRLLAITDRGSWFELQLSFGADGDLTGMAGVRAALMRDERGETFPTKAEGDAEGVAQLADGRFAVSFEQRQIIRLYDLNRDGPFGAASMGPTLEGAHDLPNNAGLEALVATEAGALLVGAEGGTRTETSLWLAPLDATEEVPAIARYPLSQGFALTSFDRLPDGAYVALERFYAPVIGARARLVRIEADAINPRDALVRTQELALIAPPLPVDNFEGVAALRMPDGATRLYIISDDNFSAQQRTLLLAFDIVEPAAD
jgi:hypothetical protein